MKTCFKCHCTKPLTAFYAHKRMADGRLNKCKTCTKLDVADRISAKQSDPDWIEAEAERQRLKSAKARASGKASPADPKTNQSWRKRNPEKVRAHSAVARAIRSGKITRKPCQECGEPNVQAHHADYSKPLDVRWLCSVHHNEFHIHA